MEKAAAVAIVQFTNSLSSGNLVGTVAGCFYELAGIRSFVRSGGSYLGIYGGAGLETQNGISLLPVERKSTQERVPSFSGSIRLSPFDHVIWENITSPVFSAWWPLQFRVTSQNDIRIGSSIRHSGKFKELMDVVDRLLYKLLNVCG